MVIFLSRHAVEQMRRRGITRAEIGEALTSVGTCYPAMDAPREKMVTLGTTMAGRRLKVITLVGRPTYVVTVADRDEEG